MAARDRDAFAARLSAEPELARLLEAFTLVAGIEADPVPPMQTRFEDLRLDAVGAEESPRLAVPRLVRVLGAAAAILAIALGAFFTLRRTEPTGPPPPVALAAIPADAMAPAVPVVPAIPAALAEYAPVGEKGLRFLDGYASARAAAALLGRPLVVFAQVPSCPICRELERDQFHQEVLASAAEPFVLGRENMMKPSPELEARLQGEENVGWPFFVVDGADGKPASVFSLDPTKPVPDAGTIARLFTAAYTSLTHAGKGRPLPWDAVRGAVAGLRAADDAGAERARSEALDRVAALAPEGSALEEAVRVRRASQAARARAALDGARDATARDGVGAGRRILAGALTQFDGTPFHADLVHVDEHLSRFGSFPILEVRK